MKLAGAPRSMTVSPDGTRVALGDYNGTVRVVSLATEKPLWKLRPGASSDDGALRWERRAAQRRYASVPIAWKPGGHSVFWMSGEALHEVSADDGSPSGTATFTTPGAGAMCLVADASSTLVACRAMFSAPWVIVETDSHRILGEIVTPERREPGTRSYEARGWCIRRWW